MKFSFLTPKPKYIFAKITKIWIMYIIFSMIIIFGFLIVLKYQTYLSQKKEHDYQLKQIYYQQEISKLESYYSRIVYESNLAKARQTSNFMVRDAVINLFNIIPDQITTTYIEVGSNSLIIKGVTPSKEVFKFLLQDPLKAIFGKSAVSFFALSDGWYRFVSISQSATSIVEQPKAEE